MSKRKTLWYSLRYFYNEEVLYYTFSLTPATKRKIKNAANNLKTNQNLLIDCLIRSSALDKGVSFYEEQKFTTSEKTVGKSYKRYKQQKARSTFALTVTSDQRLDTYSTRLNESRSEIIEFAVRSGGLEDAVTFLKALISNLN